MADKHRVTLTLRPTGARIELEKGAHLRDVLFEQGVEFPCGGQGRCRGCRIRVVEGDAPLNAAQTERLTTAEIASGWRLACQLQVRTDLTIELRQWDAAILTNETAFAFTPREGLGVAVDVGTTTVVAQLVDRETGHVLGVRTALNPQARHGGDVMSRVQFACSDGGQNALEELIRREVGALLRQALHIAGAEPSRVRRVCMVGNTVMHHLFSGVSVTPLAHYPFESEDDGLQTIEPAELGWDLPADTRVLFLPCLGSFVGSDILAGIIATNHHESDALTMLIDLGTNGEIVLGDRNRLLCASTAAGPAFEGARIAAGMRASTGAVWKVAAQDGRMACEVIGNVAARGICGSGLVDAVAAGLDLGYIKPGGRLANGSDALELCDGIKLHQSDIRQLQLAKGAIAAGVRLMLQQWGATAEDVSILHLAGAFGNYINRASGRRIGLIGFREDRVQPAGNTALLGARMALFAERDEDAAFASIRGKCRHIGLNEDPLFQEVYVEEMVFPGAPPAD